MTELAYVGVNQNGYTYCSFPYYWTSETSVVLENLHIPVQTAGGAGVNLFTAGPGRFQAFGNGLDCTPPTDGNNSILDVKFGYFRSNSTPSTPYYLLSYEAPNGIEGTLEIGNAYIKLNGATVATGTTYTGDKVTLTQPFYFFNSFNTAWAHNYVKEGHCGKVKFYENGVLTAVYTPYLDDNGVAGYYDENNQVMIYSLGNAWVAGPDAKSIKVTPSKTVLAYTGETINIAVECENAWTVTGNTFLTLSSTGDTGSTTITATAPSYSGETARTDTLTFTDAVTGDEVEKTIRQKKYGVGTPFYLGGDEVTDCYVGGNAVVEAYLGEDLVYSSGPFQGLKISPKTFTFDANTLTASLKIKSSEDWTITTLPSWLSASSASGTSGETIITLTATTQTASTADTIVVTTANFTASAECNYSIVTYVDYIHTQDMGDYTTLYIELPVSAKATSKVRIKGKSTNYRTGNYIIGNGLADTNGDWRWFGLQKEIYFDINNNRIDVGYANYSPFYGTNVFDFTLENHKWTDNIGGNVKEGTVQSNVTNSPFRLVLSVLWISQVQIWDGGTLVFDGSASKLGDQYGLYDLVSGAFITDANIGIVGEVA